MRPHTSQQFIGIKSVLVKSIETSNERQEYKEDLVKVKSFDIKIEDKKLKIPRQISRAEIWSRENVRFLSREPGKYFDICQD